MSGRIKKVFVLFTVAAALICLGAASVFAVASDTAGVPDTVSEEVTEVAGSLTADDGSEIEPTDESNTEDSDGDDSDNGSGGDEPETVPDVVWLKIPSLSSISNTTGGVKISWSSVKGAAGYRIYRKTSGGSWAKIAETTGAFLHR